MMLLNLAPPAEEAMAMREKAFLAELLPRLAQGRDVRIGPGDDCALVTVGGEALLLAVDQVVAGVHFRPDAPAAMVGRKLLCRNLSDVAAMGGTPLHALVAVAAGFPDATWLGQFMDGVAAAAAEWQVSVVGGDLTSLPGNGFAAALTITGRIVPPARVCRRRGAEPGDRLLATGQFGNAMASGHHLTFEPRLREGAFLAAGWAKAMIDVSDGLLLDATTLARASGLALTLNPERIPCRAGADLPAALGDGEDYELLWAVAADRAPELLATWPFTTPCTELGEFRAGPPGEIRNPTSKLLSEGTDLGWDHPLGSAPPAPRSWSG